MHTKNSHSYEPAPAPLPAPRSEPATTLQQSLWFWQQANPDSGIYNLAQVIRLDGPGLPSFDRRSLERALTLLARRHQALRVVLASEGETVVLREDPAATPRLALRDLTGEVEPEAALDALAAGELAQPFDLAAGPLTRLTLALLPGGGAALVKCAHHAVTDGISERVFRDELERAYGALARGEEPDLGPEPMQIGRFARRQAELVGSERGQKMRRAWMRLLDGAPGPVGLPGDLAGEGPGHTAMTGGGLEAEAKQALGELARLGGCTPLAVVLAGLAGLAARQSGAEDMVIGVAAAGRAGRGQQGMMGCCVNLLPVRLRVDPSEGFAALLERSWFSLLEAMELQDYPCEDLARRRPGRAGGGHPWIEMVLSSEEAAGPGMEDLLAGGSRPGRRFALSFMLSGGQQGPALSLEYDASRYGPGRAGRLSAELGALLSAAAAEPQAPLSGLAAMPADELERVLEFSRGPGGLDLSQTLHGRFSRLAAQRPDAVAVSDDRGEFTYAELDRLSSALAARIRGEGGAAPGEAVGVFIAPGRELVAAMLAVVKAGCVILPLDFLYPAERIAFLVADAACKLVVADSAGARAVGEAAPDCALLPPEPGSEPGPPPDATGPEDAVVLYYTSGTTGRPKGALMPHRALVRLALGCADMAPGPEDRFLCIASPGFDATTIEIWTPLVTGGRVCMAPPGTALEPRALAAYLRDQGVTVAWITASLCQQLAGEDPAMFAGMRVLATGGEVISPAAMARILKACPNLTLLNGYGPTENGTFTTTHRIRAEELDGPVPIGRPIDHTRVYLLDRNHQPVPIGAPGELCCAGEGLALGYLGRPELTGRAFVADPFSPGQRMYKSGDLARWREDGELEFLGRRDGQIKLRGYRIEPGEIERALAGLDGVSQCVVRLVGAGGGEGRLTAFVVADGFSPEDWRRELAATLPAYMVPARFLAIDAVPLTVTGKADGPALDQLARREAAPEPEGGGEAQRAVAALFAELLGAERVGPDDDFFALGGHSILLMRLAARLEQRFGARPEVPAMLAAPTPAGIAALLPEGAGGGFPPPAHQDDGGEGPVSAEQRRLWVLHRLAPEQPGYPVVLAARLRGALDLAALEAALGDLARRHDVLACVYRQGGDGNLSQRVLPGWRPALTRHDHSSAADPLAQALAAMSVQAERPFDLAAEPPLRCALHRLADDDWALCLHGHHIALDGWSLGILARDLSACYRARLEGREPPPAPEFTCRDYARWQGDYLKSPRGERDRDYWARALGDLPEPLELPCDRPRPARPDNAGGYVPLELPAEVAASLEGLARSHGTTMFAALDALVRVFLLRHTGQGDVTLGAPVAGRPLPAWEGVAGCFVNTVPLRGRLDPAQGFGALLERTARTCAGAFEHQAYPFDRMVELAGAGREPGRNPLFDVWVALHDGTPPAWDLPGLTAEPLEVDTGTAKFDLGFHFIPRAGGGLRCLIEYSAALFDRASIERMGRRLAALAAAAAAEPERPLADLEAMPTDERELVAAGFNRTDHPAPQPATAVEAFAAQAGRTPDATALVHDRGVISFASFRRMSLAVAAALSRAGVRRGDFVGLCARRSPALLAGVHGIMAAGAAYVPLSPELPAARLKGMAEDARTPVVLAQAGHLDLARGLGGKALDLDALLAEEPPDVPPPGPGPDDAAYAIFTSGSTGRPKGVVIEHRSLLNRVFWMQHVFPLGPDDVILHKTPYTFDVSVWELVWWSWFGAGLALLEPGEEKNPAAIVDAIERHRVTVMHFVPSMLRAFLDHLEAAGTDPARLASLRYVFASGEALPRDLVERFNALLHAGAGTELHNLYGPTEATVDVTWHPCSPDPGPGPVPIGKPVHNTAIYVLDPGLRPVPIGVRGEIYIGGVQVAREYLNRPDLTAAAFLPNPFRPGGRMYKTGDAGRWRPDGAVEYLGRLDLQLKVRGFRIETGEVERALVEAPGVVDAVITPRQAVDGSTELVAHLVPGPGYDPDTVRASLRRALPEYMVPAELRRIEALPLTPSGKADRKALARAASQASAPSGPSAPAARAGGALGRILAMWRELLPGRDPGPEQSFFDAGGSSLLLIRLHAMLERAWPGRFALADLFRLPTAAAMAAHLGGEAAEAGAAPAAAAGPVAVVGMALRLCGLDSAEALWADILAGRDRIGELPQKRRRQAMDLMAALGLMRPGDPEPAFRRAAYLDDIAGFDPARLGMPPGDAALLDPAQRLFLETAIRALEDAGQGGAALKDARVGVFAAASGAGVYGRALLRARPEDSERVFILNVPSSLATRLSYLMDWRGPAMMVDTACSSGLVALHQACAALAAGECRVALAGAVSILPTPFDQGGRLAIDSSDGRARTFDAAADGTGMGEGALVFLLKPLEAALADGDPIHAVIAGSAVNQDGASMSIAAPNPEAQAEVIAEAARHAGVRPSALAYVEAHGTATQLGDPVEVRGLTLGFGPDAEPGAVPIGSAKGNYGHLDSAAGSLGLAKAILCLRAGVAPPQPHFSRPNPKIDFASAPVFVPAEPTPLEADKRPFMAGVSSFGISRINCHVVVREPPEQRAAPVETAMPQVVALSAGSARGLAELARRTAEALEAVGGWSLAAVAHTLASGRAALPFRLALACDSAAELPGLLRRAAEGAQASPDPVRPDPELDAQAAGLLADADAWDMAAAERVVALFAAGASLAQAAPTGIGQPGRVRLPGPDMERIPCWADFSPRKASGAGPWLGEPAAEGPDAAIHPLPVDDPGFWPLREHRLHGEPTLVGMALPQLCLEAARRHLGVEALAISDVAWRAPLDEGAVQPVVQVRHQGDGLSLRLASRRDGGWRLHAEATLRPLAGAAPALDSAALAAGHGEALAVQRASQAAGPVSVSRRWDLLASLSRDGDGSVWAELDLAGTRSTPGADLHPAALDVAASLAAPPGHVPAACAAIKVYGPLPERALVHARPAGGAPGSALVDLSICGPDGVVALEAEGILFLPAGPAAPARPALARWDSAPLPAGEPEGLGPVLVLGPKDAAEAARRALAGTGVELAEIGPVGSGWEAHRQAAAMCLRAGAGSVVYAAGPGAEAAIELAGLLSGLAGAGLERSLRVLALGGGGVDAGGAPIDPGQALLCGPVLCAPIENPLLRCGYLDLGGPPEGDALLAELAGLAQGAPGLEGVAALRDGRRLVRRWTPAEAGEAAPAFRADGVYVFSGGLGAMALALAGSLPAGAAAALLHRAPGPEQRPGAAQAIEAMRGRGLRVLSLACDVCDEQELSEALERVRRELGAITGVVHTAGVPGMGILARKDRKGFEAVLAPKVRGTALLHRLTEADRPELFVLASSLTGLLGGPGQADYAAANAYLDAFAAWRRAKGLPALAVAWPTISGGGMAQRAGGGAERGGVPLKALPGLLDAALAAGQPAVALLPLDLEPARPAESAPEARRADDAPPADLEAACVLVAAEWGRVLGYDSLEADADFFDLGGDSIHATQVVNRINQRLGTTLGVADLLEAASVSGLASLLMAQLGGPAPAQGGLPRAPEADDYPLTSEQEGIWRAEMRVGATTAFNLPHVISASGPLEPERLERALRKLIDRHDSLRCAVIEREDAPRMVIADDVAFSLGRGQVSAGGLDAYLAALVSPFDLSRPPLMRAELIEVDDGRSLLFLDVHHLAADAQSFEILVEEIEALYQGRELPPPAARYRDYAFWQRGLIDSQRGQEDLAWWTARLGFADGAPPMLELPADRPRPAVHTFGGDALAFDTPPELLAGLRELAKEGRTTMFNLVLAAWSLLLFRYTGQQRLTVGLADSGRHRAELERMPGMFVNLLPLPVEVRADDTVAGLLLRTAEVYRGALGHRNLGYQDIIRAMGSGLPADRTPLAEFSLSYMNFERGDYGGGEPGLSIAGMARKNSAKNDLAVFALEQQDRLLFSLEYYADIFDRERMERMQGHFLNLLRAMVAGGLQAPVAELSPLGGRERRLVLEEFAGADSDYPREGGLFALFARQARERPEKTAVAGTRGKLTYAELERNALRLAAGLRVRGLEPGGAVALHYVNSPELVTGMLGVLAAGGAYVVLDPANPPERAAAVLADAGCALALADAPGRVLLAGLDSAPPALSLADALADEPLAEPHPARGGDVACVIFTSGTTGRPKGAELPHRGIPRLVLGGYHNSFSPDDVVLNSSAPAFDACSLEVFTALITGATLVTVPREDMIEPEQVERTLRDFGVTWTFMTAALFRQMADQRPGAFSGMRCIDTGGEVVSPLAAARVLAACPGLTVNVLYGPTECSAYATCHHVSQQSAARPMLPIGRVLANTRGYVLDAFDQPAPIGVWGELLLGGDGLSPGYRGRPGLTAERFVAVAGVPCAPLYRTGDICRWRSDGELEFWGRRDAQVKLRGLRIELDEVEGALGGAPGVRQAAAVICGQGESRHLVGALVPEGEIDAEVVCAHLAARLPAYMLPSRLVALDALPVTRNGKTDRVRLASLAQDLPALGAEAGEEPRGELEELVADVFARILGGSRPKRGASFFGLGGHSLLATKAANAIAEASGRTLPLGQFFRGPTPAAIAAFLEGRDREDQAIPPAPPAADYPLSPGQQRLYVLHQMKGGDVAYNMFFVLELEPGFDPALMDRAWGLAMRRQESLRTGFIEQRGEPRQVVAESLRPPGEVLDLRGQDQPRAQAMRIMRAQIKTPFDLERPPLFRVRYLRLPDSVLMLVVMHHIIADGWSMQLLFPRLARDYAELAAGGQPEAKAPAVGYKDYAVWQAGRDLSGQAGFWRQRLTGAPDNLALPFDRQPPAVRGFRGAAASRAVDPELLEQIRSAAGRLAIPASSFMLAVFAALLQRLTGRQDLIIGLGGANRVRPELEDMVGFFVNVLPLRLQVDPEMDFAELARQAHQRASEVLDRQDYPLERLLRELGVARVSNRQPLVNVSFAYHSFELGGERGLEGLPFRAFSADELDRLEPRTAKFDITLFVHDHGRTMELEFEYDSDLFEADTMESWLDYLETFLALAARPDG